jgi:hypothetical protein
MFGGGWGLLLGLSVKRHTYTHTHTHTHTREIRILNAVTEVRQISDKLAFPDLRDHPNLWNEINIQCSSWCTYLKQLQSM